MSKNRERDIVAMPVETTARELLPKLYLASKLAEQGFTSYLGLKSMVHEVAVRSGRAVFLDKGYHSGVSEGQYAKLREAGCLIVDLDEENGVDFRDFHMLNVRMPDELFSLVDHVMVWGDAQYRHLKAHRASFDPERISVTGHPRFDLLKPAFRDLYEERVSDLRRQYGRFILLNTNTKYGNNMNGRDFIIRNYGSRVKGLIERLAYDDRRLECNVSLARRLAAETPYSVVLRPHPEEDLSVYRRIFADNPKVHPVYDDAPIYWLLAAELVIHNHSTTGLESAILGRPTISFSPVAVDEGFVPWIPIACSLQMTDEDEVLNFVRKDEGDRQPSPDVAAILQQFFSFDLCSATSVVETIRRLAEASPPDKDERGLAAYLAKLRVRGILHGFGGEQRMDPLARQKLRDLRPAVVRTRFQELLRQSSLSRAVALQQLHPLLYRVAPR